MMNAGIRTSIVVAVLGLAACAPQHAYQGPPSSGPAPAAVSPGRETEMQIERAMDRYSSMLAMMDADGLSAMYTSDGVMERQSGPPLHGRDEIRAFLSAPANNVRVLSNQMITNSLAYNGPQVVQAGEFHQSARVNGKVVNATGRFEATWVRGPRGAWYIAHMVTRRARN